MKIGFSIMKKICLVGKGKLFFIRGRKKDQVGLGKPYKGEDERKKKRAKGRRRWRIMHAF